MSIAVSIEDLPAAIEAQIGWCYVLSVAASGQPRLVAVVPQWTADGALVVDVGGRTAENIAARPNVALVFPPAAADGYSLIVDGEVSVDDRTVMLRPVSAVMHRPAVSAIES